MSITISPFDFESTGQFILVTKLHSSKQHTFDITITDGTRCWKHQLCAADRFSSLDVSDREYWELARRGLDKQDTAQKSFSYDVQLADTNAQFVLRYTAGAVPCMLLNIQLEIVGEPGAMVRQIMFDMIEYVKFVKHRSKKLQSDRDALKASLSSMTEVALSAGEQQSALTDTLLTRFALVLNAKKEEINRLREEIVDLHATQQLLQEDLRDEADASDAEAAAGGTRVGKPESDASDSDSDRSNHGSDLSAQVDSAVPVQQVTQVTTQASDPGRGSQATQQTHAGAGSAHPTSATASLSSKRKRDAEQCPDDSDLWASSEPQIRPRVVQRRGRAQQSAVGANRGRQASSAAGSAVGSPTSEGWPTGSHSSQQSTQRSSGTKRGGSQRRSGITAGVSTAGDSFGDMN